MGPAGAVLFPPPFRDPFNYYFDPLVPIGIDMVAAAMHDRFLVEGKPGATMRSGAPYSTWWNGGLLATAYFSKIIGVPRSEEHTTALHSPSNIVWRLFLEKKKTFPSFTRFFKSSTTISGSI